MSLNPKITVITVVWNGANFLEKTILSVANQTYDNMDYIIIDGGSTDNTLDVIRKFDKNVDYWISEKDAGIYYAMNKGIEVATGDWINFMNAGDTFFSNDTVAEFARRLDLASDVAYGDTQLILSFGPYIKRANSAFGVKNSMPFVHQAAFARRELLKELYFDTSYRICADRDLFYRAYKQGCKFQYMPFVIAKYEAEEGLSSVNLIALEYEMGRVVGLTGKLGWRISHKRYILALRIKNALKRLLPGSMVLTIRRGNAARNYKEE